MSIACNILLFSPQKEGSKSNIAAKFQNALNVHFLPPIGVFWDIENCQVPKGKSAIALVQNIREKFFANHREAEFMCVCDINKESKTVIQELILAQVTVVHISATSKNAADDKLKQCMRRYVDTHGVPSTLLLISDDVNFSSDLSDFRHRHNIRIILLHRGRAHSSLLACAHEHYEFSTIAFDLPSRSPVKSSDRRPSALIITDLPSNRNAGQVKILLRKLSQNCGGKVSKIRGNKAYIKFANADAAERAQKRMDREIVFGSEISVNFCNTSDWDFSVSPSKRNKNSSNEVSGSSSSSRDSSASPNRESKQPKTHNTRLPHKKFDFPPPPVLDSQTFPSLLKNSCSFKEFQTCSKDFLFPAPPNMEIIGDSKSFQLDWNRGKCFNNASIKNPDVSAFTPFKKDSDTKVKYSQKNVGRVSPFVMQDCDKNLRSAYIDATNIRHSNTQIASTSNSYLFSNSGLQNSAQNAGPSFEIQRISDPFFYPTTWSGNTNIVNDSNLSIVRSNQTSTVDNSSSVELYVSNLDPAFDVNEMKKVLLSVFREHIMVLHISMSIQPDGSAKAMVKVPSLQDAQFAISRLHRKKIGHKRILISYVSSDRTLPFHVLKSEAIALLNDIPNKSLPLIKFRELYEKRYHRPIAVSELYKMREAVTIQGDSGSRIVYLNLEYCNTPSLPDSEDSQESNNVERPYCEVHFHVSASQGWAEQYNICPLPLVHISLKTLSTAVHTLLDSHQGSLPLISFCGCYEAEIGPMPIVGNYVSNKEESIEFSLCVNSTLVSKTQKGVPLEHLIACIAGVEVAKSVLCIKKVQWLENKPESKAAQNFSPALMGQLTLFGREVMDLLKSQPQCLVQFNKFIPTYHHHFGRQCRVADYGFTKLIDLLEAIPHVVQVLGEGQNRQVTLTHKTQVKRFAAELLRILKSRASKQIAIVEFAEAYEQVIEKPFEITNYGVCEIEDMLDEVPENVVVISSSGSDTIISIPKREQTPEEIERTKQFAEEVIELMKHTTNCTMAFNKFIPSYHHHFGKQCRVADYGFTKLIELFEAIPSVLEVKGAGEDKILKLIENEQHKILSERLVTVIKAQPTEMVDLTQLCCAYCQVHGHVLRPSDFGFSNLNELLEKLSTTFKVFLRSKRSYVCLVDHELIHQISLNVRRLLMEEKEGRMLIKDICRLYKVRFGPNADLISYFRDMTDVLEITDDFLQLTPLQLLARKLILLLQDNCSQVLLCSLTSLYNQKYGVSFTVFNYGFKSLHSMLEYLSDYFVIKGKKLRRMVYLTPNIVGNTLPAYQILPQILKKTHSIDIIDEPVPSCIPSPNIEPHVKDDWEDLMGFETPPVRDAFCMTETLFDSKVIEENSAKLNVIRTSSPTMTPKLVRSDVPITFHQCSSATTLNCSVPSLKIFHKSSFLSSETSISTFKETSSEIHKKAEALHSVTCLTKQNICEWELKPVNSAHSGDEPNFCEHFNTIPSSKIYQNSLPFKDVTQIHNQPLCTKDDISSTKSTPTSEGRLQSRRSRIAAQFSEPFSE